MVNNFIVLYDRKDPENRDVRNVHENMLLAFESILVKMSHNKSYNSNYFPKLRRRR